MNDTTDRERGLEKIIDDLMAEVGRQANEATFGPAILSNLGEAANSEIAIRRESAERALLKADAARLALAGPLSQVGNHGEPWPETDSPPPGWKINNPNWPSGVGEYLVREDAPTHVESPATSSTSGRLPMATKGRIQVIGVARDGSFFVQGVDTASAQLLAEARGKPDGLTVVAAWPRRRGGRAFPALRLSTAKREAKR